MRCGRSALVPERSTVGAARASENTQGRPAIRPDAREDACVRSALVPERSRPDREPALRNTSRQDLFRLAAAEPAALL